MKMTRIYWKRFNRPVLTFFGFILGAVFTSGYLLTDLVQQKKAIASQAPVESNQQVSSNPINGARITAYSKLGNFENYRIMTNDLQQLTSDELKSQGYQLKPISACHLIISKGRLNEEVRC